MTAVSLMFCLGAGSAIRSSSTGAAARASDSRRQLCRAVTNDFQFAIASSTGASDRDAENRGRQHHARGRFLVDHEIGADAQNARTE